MKSASSPALRLRVIALCTLTISTFGMLSLSGCASFSGISSDKHMAQPGDYAVERSLAGQGNQGQWPATNWIEQFGDPQLTALIAEAMESSPSLQQAQARIA